MGHPDRIPRAWTAVAVEQSDLIGAATLGNADTGGTHILLHPTRMENIPPERCSREVY